MKNLKKYLFPILTTVLVVAALIMLIAGDCGSLKASVGKASGDISGWEMIFGYEASAAGQTIKILKLNFVGLLAVVLLVVGLVLVWVKEIKLSGVISACLLAVAAILLFVLPATTSWAKDYADIAKAGKVKVVGDTLLYVSAVLTLLSAGTALADKYVKL